MAPPEPLRGPQLRTQRLLLRRWSDADLEPFAAINADPEVMEHFPAPLTREQSDELVAGIELCFEQEGFGGWAVQVLGEAQLIGFVGLFTVGEQMPFAPSVEIGWRIARPFWGRGLALEAAAAAVDFAFDVARLDSILAYTAAGNTRSQRLMGRLGMIRDPREDFDHPALPPGHALAPHVLYRLWAEDWDGVPGAQHATQR
jgi:RimJ/RimL family protein N-acetyltransferase